MNIKLHARARTTPAIRREIALSNEPASVLAERFGISLMTVYKWKRRQDFLDRPHTPHRLPTTMTPAQEAIAVELRKTLLLPLDDLLSVMREFVCPEVSRSGLGIGACDATAWGRCGRCCPKRPNPPTSPLRPMSRALFTST